MDRVYKFKNRPTAIIIWAARILGTISGAFWLFALIGGFIQELGTPIPIDGMILGGLITINAAGVIIAWRKEKIGAIIIIAAAVSLCTFSYIDAGHHKIFALLFSGSPFLLSGILFIIGWWRLKKAGSR